MKISKKATGKSTGVNPREKYGRDRAIIYLLTYAGLRVDELSNLKLTDLDMELNRIRILGRGRKIRTVPMSNTLWQELTTGYSLEQKCQTRKSM
ncbi:tyrosine-type recombinase/integrase [Bacillus sp. EB600]|uniref:tyrosine-type recombinase/integrase n=1 Tax=Bacillus sp. EB600 TaxID=2806345 RepID=UPI002109FDDF|nr:tyrosine-type recombinase/integrase [Bacillus sp. EB600]